MLQLLAKTLVISFLLALTSAKRWKCEHVQRAYGGTVPVATRGADIQGKRALLKELHEYVNPMAAKGRVFDSAHSDLRAV